MICKIHAKTQDELDTLKAAGALSAKALRLTGAAVKPGISTFELDALAENIIRREGGIPGFKGYGGFPGTICASINEQIVHGIPSHNVILQEGDIISIDTGAIIDGYYGDNAATFVVGSTKPEIETLLKVTERSMWAGIGAALVGNHVGDIGHAVQSYCESYGYGVIRCLCGHGVGQDMHEAPDVPNYGHPKRGPKLINNMVIAIEPMISLSGEWRAVQLSDGWTFVTDDLSPAAHFEKTIAVTENGPMILTTEDEEADLARMKEALAIIAQEMN